MRMISEYMTVLRPLVSLIANETTFTCEPSLRRVLKENPRLIIALSHSTPLSWLPSAALLAVEWDRAGGGSRRPIGVMDKVFFQMPLIREIARMITQTRRAVSYFELFDRFERGETLDLVMFPEGSNCFFGAPDEIQEFRSNKFIELALRTNTPILTGAHAGSEAWARALEVPREWMSKLDLLPEFVFKFVEKRIKKTGLFVLPLLPKPMAHFELRCEIYRPELRAEDLALDPLERSQQLRKEGERIRARMGEILDAIHFAGARPAHDADGAKPRLSTESQDTPSEMISNLNNL